MGSWGEQFSTGDQGDNRREFWKDSYSKCPSCGGKKIKCDRDCAGCRHNGDGYGTEVFTCEECGWLTSFQYDEADTPYFYETKYWGKPPPEPRPKQWLTLTEEDRETFRKMCKVAPEDKVIYRMRIKGFSDADISAFLADPSLVKLG